MVLSVWLFKHKFHADGTLSGYKARLVANGSSQELDVDFDKTFSPVVKPATICTVLSLAVSRQWPIHQLDVKNAFFNGDLSETVYMHQPLGYATRVRLLSSPATTDYRFLHNEFDMTDLGKLNYFIGISDTRTPTGLFLSQKKYAMQLFERAHMVICNPSRTLVDTEFKLVQQICLYMHDPRKPHFAALKHANWAGCPSTRRSTSGYYVILGDNLLSWSAKRQHTLSRSSAEAEYHGVANVVFETAWLHNLLRELHSPLSTATLVYYDNVSAIYLSANPVQHQWTKHIEIDIHFVRDMVTAGHQGTTFSFVEDFRSRLSVHPPLAQTAGAY
ncbi:ribonuclease H-like domain-containing protein [Tanacetum coccineum]